MEVDEIQRQAFKFQRIGSNGRSGSNGNSTSLDANNLAHPDEEEDRVILKRSAAGGGGGGAGGGGMSGGNGMDFLGGGGGMARLCGWPSSRIVRVSRASGGKDRHSKVLTSKGLRDRRVRLSVTTAIQFYDLQDRLGYDQPSKAVEWLLKAAASSISELPSLNPAFPDTPKQMSDEKRSSDQNTEPGFESAEVELDGDPNFQHHQQGQNVKSACSSTSETSKGSGLSLSRSESRIKARERARGRAAEKEKEKDQNDSHTGVVNHHQNVSPISQNSSFTELLTAGINNNNNSPNGSCHRNSGGGNGGGDSKWAASMDYLFAPSSSRGGAQTSSGFPGHMNSLQQFTTTGENHQHHHQHHHNHNPELQHFSFVPENFVPVATTAGESYNLNFSMSSSGGGFAGFNRGTLQSNSSPSTHLPPSHLQRFNNSIGDSNINMPFFIGSTAASSNNASASPVENHHHQHQHQHHQFPAGFDARLQLCYGETRHSDNQKGKGKH